jgi:hypothetical protein
MVRDTGIEPVTSSVSGKRSPAELIAPEQSKAEVETGIEPVCTALQAVASPLGHSTAGLIPQLRADDGIRTRDPHLGKVMRYQLRYIRAPRTRSSSVAKHDDSPTQRSRTNLLTCFAASLLMSLRQAHSGQKPLRANLAPRSSRYRSRGSVEERPLHTRKVAGSIPAGTTSIDAAQTWYIELRNMLRAT